MHQSCSCEEKPGTRRAIFTDDEARKQGDDRRRTTPVRSRGQADDRLLGKAYDKGQKSTHAYDDSILIELLKTL